MGNLKKLLSGIFFGLLVGILAVSCGDNREISLVNKALNRYNFKNKFEISLPYKYYFSEEDIFNTDSVKIGTVVIGYEKLKQPLNGKSLLEAFKNHKVISTVHADYENACHDCKLLKSDTIEKGVRKWYYTVESSSGNEKNIFKYGTITHENKILVIHFFNAKVDEFVIGQHTDILRSIALE